MASIEGIRRRIASLSAWDWAAVAVVAVAAFLRLWRLGAESLWVDELATLGQIRSGFAFAASETLVRGTPPVYYLLQVALYAVLPHGETGLRLLSAVADIASVGVLYLVGRRLLSAPWAVAACALYAVSLRAIWFAQEARAYSLSIMLTLVVVLTLLRLIERPTWRRAVVHAVAVIALLYTHVYAAFAVFGVEMFVVFAPRLWRRVGLKWVAAMVAAVLAYVPWMLIVIGQARSRAGLVDTGEWSIDRPVGLVTPIIKSIAEFAPGRPSLIPYSGPTGWTPWLWLALVVFGVLGLAAFARREDADDTRPDLGQWERRALVACWLAGVFVLGVVVSQVAMPVFSFRMATQAVPVLCLAAASGLRQLWRPAGIALLAVLLVVGSRGLDSHYRDSAPGGTYEKEQWRQATRAVERTDADAVLVVPAWHARHMGWYGELLGAKMPEMTGVDRALTGEALDAKAEEITAGARKVLVVSSHAKADAEGRTELERALESKGWRRVKRGGVRGVRLNTYEAP